MPSPLPLQPRYSQAMQGQGGAQRFLANSAFPHHSGFYSHFPKLLHLRANRLHLLKRYFAR